MLKKSNKSLSLLEKIKKNKFVQEFLHPDSRKKFYKYLVVGFSSVGLEMGLFVFFRDVLSLDKTVGNLIAATIIFLFNFILNRQWAFKAKSNVFVQLSYYTPLYLFNVLIINGLVFNILTKQIFYNDVLVQIPFTVKQIDIKDIFIKAVLIGLIVSWNFILYKKIIYKTKTENAG
jgi:putative flippase GtrA